MTARHLTETAREPWPEKVLHAACDAVIDSLKLQVGQLKEELAEKDGRIAMLEEQLRGAQ